MKKVFLVPYFGKFPNYIQLWLNSCKKNETFEWIMMTDCNCKNLSIPKNVRIINSKLSDIEEILKSKIDSKIRIKTPYKLCDFRVVYWIILDHFKIEYDFWGYCDIDLLFGDLNKFITDDILNKHDKILSNGHLTLFSSSKDMKYLYRKKGSIYSWEEVFFSNKNFGFDEHHGINKICNKNGYKEYKNLSIIADINSHFKNFYLFYEPFNEKKQFFSLNNGKIIQTYFIGKEKFEREYIYIHLQKRKININIDNINSDNYLINNRGINNIDNVNIMKNLEFNHETLSIKIDRIRTKLRFYKHKILNVI